MSSSVETTVLSRCACACSTCLSSSESDVFFRGRYGSSCDPNTLKAQAALAENDDSAAIPEFDVCGTCKEDASLDKVELAEFLRVGYEEVNAEGTVQVRLMVHAPLLRCADVLE